MVFQPHREEMGKEDWKATRLFSERQFKYPVGLALSISEEGSSFGGCFLGGGVWTEAAPGEGFGWSFHSNLPDSSDADAWGWSEAFTQSGLSV